jgi:hypothetical protein
LRKPPVFPYGRVERLWPEATVVCLGSGPSLTREDVAAVRGRARVIAINTTYTLAPWADVLYACDARWWNWQRGARDFTGLRFALTKDAARWGVQVLKNTGTNGLEHDRSGLRNGRNSGYQAVNLAVHLGARRIVLLGYDMQKGPQGVQHWHPEHPVRLAPSYDRWRQMFESLVAPLARLGVEVINCTRRTALTAFPCRPLEEVLGECRPIHEALHGAGARDDRRWGGRADGDVDADGGDDLGTDAGRLAAGTGAGGRTASAGELRGANALLLGAGGHASAGAEGLDRADAGGARGA